MAITTDDNVDTASSAPSLVVNVVELPEAAREELKPYAFRRATKQRTCRTCLRTVEVGNLCVTRTHRNSAAPSLVGSGIHTQWRHLWCSRVPSAFPTNAPDAALPGFLNLDATGQAAVRRWLKGFKRPANDASDLERGSSEAVAMTEASELGASSSSAVTHRELAVADAGSQEGAVAGASAGPLAPTAKPTGKATKVSVRRHVERVHVTPWRPFDVDSYAHDHHRTERVKNAHNLLIRLQHEIHARRECDPFNSAPF